MNTHVITESLRPANNVLVNTLNVLTFPLRRRRGRKRSGSVDHLPDRLLADIGLTRQPINGIPHPWSMGAVRPTTIDES